MRLTAHAQGVYPIAPTPFLDDGRVDFAAIDRLIDFYLCSGASGITVLGQLGEAAKLEHGESLEVATRMIRRAGDLPVVVGVTAPGFAAMRALTREVMERGAAGVMIAPPHTLRSDEQIVGYYQQAVEAIGSDVPFVLQDYPLTFSVQMSPDVIRRIVNQLDSCVMLKHEDWPGLEKISALRRFEAEGSMRRISILCGNNALFLDQELRRGADGANTGYCFPDMLCEMLAAVRAGNIEQALDLFDAHLPLLRYEQQPGVGLAVRKYVLMRRGLLRSDRQRRPFTPLSEQATGEVETLLARLARRDPRAALEPR
ncbi:dihydrodipicolinate synthase family protein [Pseudomonas sp. NBRC 100443]|uniref:dihydrodipicolinate synthase family protein n=1 Tax=Pseudomonas sp. NBRC 100443 TaxID=1113665 RepID=UPI0024A05C48|nr:dihydrodipicolinate synthase family protein [Pseudomonas sp. NBRC 100443]GLU36535.1 dihydrodipicolinate synthase family protein [Pseudomonas sp. NBRC 100443]